MTSPDGHPRATAVARATSADLSTGVAPLGCVMTTPKDLEEHR